MKLRPTANRIIIDLDPERQLSEFVVAPSSDCLSYSATGRVIGWGPDVERLRVAGERVAYNVHAHGQLRGGTEERGWVCLRETEAPTENVTVFGTISEDGMRIEPLFDRIVVRQQAAEERTKGGLYVPVQVQKRERPAVGTVIAVGPQVQTVTEGACIVFSRYCGNPVDVSGEDLIVMREEDVIAVVLE